MVRRLMVVPLLGLGLFLSPYSAQADHIRVNRTWDILAPVTSAPESVRSGLLEAAMWLDEDGFKIAGKSIDREALLRIVQSPHVVPRLREVMGQAVDPVDFLRFTDDVLNARQKWNLSPNVVSLSSGRARTEGILLHPDDVYGRRLRRYGQRTRWLRVDEIGGNGGRPVHRVPRWSLLGPIWTAAYPQPDSEAEHLDALSEQNPSKDLHRRLTHLFDQLRAQGAHVTLTSSIRSRKRGYLLYGSYVLSRARSRRQVEARITELRQIARRYRIRVPIRWEHPQGWRYTITEARKMADTFGVAFASLQGALHSDHYDGRAVDFTVTDLPPHLQLISYDGQDRATFDLSGPSETRDLSLTPRLVKWVERAYDLRKLKTDYPHWTDVKRGCGLPTELVANYPDPVRMSVETEPSLDPSPLLAQATPERSEGISWTILRLFLGDAYAEVP